MNSSSIKVNTTINKDSILQHTYFDVEDRDLNSVQNTLCRQVINLQEQGVREALIKLGWTPPALEA